jgi:hypothetical protein
LKIVKKFLTAVEEKKAYDIGTNILMKTDIVILSFILGIGKSITIRLEPRQLLLVTWKQ